MLNPYILVASPFAGYIDTLRVCLNRRCNNDWRVETRPRYDDKTELPDDVLETMVLAMVELRMKMPGDKEDRSGLKAAEAIKRKYGVPAILMACERPDNGLVNQWMREGKIDGFLLIRSSYEKRWNDVDELLKTSIRINKSLETPYDSSPEKWLEMAERLIPVDRRNKQKAPFSAADIAHLFHRLFPAEVAWISLDGVPGGASDAATARARVIHRGFPTEETLVIKYGERSIVHAEEEKVKQYVEQLGPRGVAPIRWSAQLKDCAAVAYWSVQSRFGGQPEFLSDYLCRRDVHHQKKRDVIESIFTAVFAPWYRAFLEQYGSKPAGHPANGQRKRPQDGDKHKPVPLIRHCVAHLWGHRDLPAAIDKIKSMHAEMPERAPDPVRIIETAIQKSQTEIDWLCPQHGDLHPKNIFVVDDEPWIIDFGDVHMGHPMKDLATLEASLRFTVFYRYEHENRHFIVDAENRLQRFDGAPELLKELKGEPFWPKRTTQDSDWPEFTVNAFWCTRVIRTLAASLFSGVDRWQEHYGLMLMLSLLKIAGISRITEKETEADAQERKSQAYLAASLHAETCQGLLFGSPSDADRVATSSAGKTAEKQP